MSLTTRNLTAYDLYAGAGGETSGLDAAGYFVSHAVNHWDLAVASHQANHPLTAHDCVDVRLAHPSRYPTTHLFWASPECKTYSNASGYRRRKATQAQLWTDDDEPPQIKRSRATLHEVYIYAEFHRYPVIVVENVVELTNWNGFYSWLNEMAGLGYRYKILSLNAMFFNMSQRRDRIYVVFWQKTLRDPDLAHRPLAFCPMCQKEATTHQHWKKEATIAGKWNSSYYYECDYCGAQITPYTKPALDIIDWQLPCTTIGERKKPLADNTIKRIKAGLRRFAHDAFIVNLAHSKTKAEKRIHGLHNPMPTQTATHSFALAIPFLIQYYGRVDAVSGLDGAIPTITPGNRHALIVPPFIAELKGTNTARSTTEPLMGICAGGNHHMLIQPHPVDQHKIAAYLEDPTSDEVVAQCGYRMLSPMELKLGQSFKRSYILLGSSEDQVRQIGNAVPCNVAQWIGTQLVPIL